MIEFFWSLFLVSISQIARRLTGKTRYAWAGRIGRVSGRLLKKRHRAVKFNLDTIALWGGKQYNPGMVFENYAYTLCDFITKPSLTITVQGRENAEEARKHGKGVIFLTSHLGHWELGAHILQEWGWPATAVYQPYRQAAMRRFIQKHRAQRINYLAVGEGAANGINRILENQKIIAMLADRPFGEEGIFVELCGKKARLPRGPFLFACRNGSPVLPCFVIRESLGCYKGIVEAPIWPQSKKRQSVDEMAKQMARVLEKNIAQHAEQWYCFEKIFE